MSFSHGKILKNLVRDSNLTTEEFAKKLDTTRQTLDAWTKKDVLKDYVILKIINSLQLPSNYFDNVKSGNTEPNKNNIEEMEKRILLLESIITDKDARIADKDDLIAELRERIHLLRHGTESPTHPKAKSS